ncbi:hypothetical protein [Embleya sp. NPDC059237]|uniref:hypothetical protein n=1 Tax=Embleya sp. NPDC059237 TaxID=3346784 RepID=UPI0036CF6157
MTRIVAVHGVGNYAPGHQPEAVSTARAGTWARHLASGLNLPAEEVDLKFAYYAHHLRQAQPTMQGPGDELGRLAIIDPEAAELVEKWLETLGLPQVTTQGRLAIPLRHAVEFVAKRFSLDGRLTQIFVARFFRELATYLRDPQSQERHAAREEVAASIKTHQPGVVIAHSLGTVVAYEALHAHPELQVDLLVTMGSPLALPHAVFQRLEPRPENDTGCLPPGVKRWVNIADRGDPVAIPRPLKKYFPGIDVDLEESIGLFDFHRASNYLQSSAVAAAMAPHVKQ